MKRGLFTAAGAAVGFAYYYYIGCASGSCPITSNPYISTAYGALVGIVGGWQTKKKETSA
ncbi:MAG: DUF6132 family protein [bacterium]